MSQRPLITGTGRGKSPVDHEQTLKAALALARHIEKRRDERKVDRPGLLDGDEENLGSNLDIPIWLIITAKHHIATSHSLKPGKANIPHPLYTSPQTRICLITADAPEHDPDAYQTLTNHPQFSKDLRDKIVKIMAYSKLAKQYRAFDRRRQLLSQFDVFLADERILHLLPVALGRTFYKSTTKRPIPVTLTGKELWGKKQKRTVFDRLRPKERLNSCVIGKAADVAADIEKALATTAIHLSPSASTAIKIAYAGWPAEWIAENADAALIRAIQKYIPKGWKGLKSLHLKGSDTAALPIWLADELWQDDEDILDDVEIRTSVAGEQKSGTGRKQVAGSDSYEETEVDEVPRKRKRITDIPPPAHKMAKKNKTNEGGRPNNQRSPLVTNVQPMDARARIELLMNKT